MYSYKLKKKKRNCAAFQIYNECFKYFRSGFFAAASFMSFQQCLFNFGNVPFKYPPTDREYKKFNDYASLKPEDKVVLPRHIYLDQLRKLSVREDSCTLCFDQRASVRLLPCNHRYYIYIIFFFFYTLYQLFC